MHAQRSQPARLHRLVRVSIAIAAAALCGCAPSLESVRKQHQDAVTCCATVRELPFEKLAPGDEVAFSMDERAKAFAFPTGKSLFRAFALPAAGRNRITVSSYVVGDGPSSWFVFYPVAQLLDDEFRVVRTVGPDAFSWNTASMFETSGWRKKLEASFEVSAAERYLVLLTTDDLLARGTSVSMLRTFSGVVGGVPILVPVGTQDVIVPDAPAGNLRVRVMPIPSGG